jgi:hypothetical protein
MSDRTLRLKKDLSKKQVDDLQLKHTPPGPPSFMDLEAKAVEASNKVKAEHAEKLKELARTAGFTY